MSAAGHARGSAAISRDISRVLDGSGYFARAERRAISDERAALLAQISTLSQERDRERDRAVRLTAALLRSRATARAERATWKGYATKFRRLLDASDRNRSWMGGLIRALLSPAQVQAYRDDEATP